jgi:hypothetical protein
MDTANDCQRLAPFGVLRLVAAFRAGTERASETKAVTSRRTPKAMSHLSKTAFWLTLAGLLGGWVIPSAAQVHGPGERPAAWRFDPYGDFEKSVTHHWTEVDLAGSGGNLPVVT